MKRKEKKRNNDDLKKFELDIVKDAQKSIYSVSKLNRFSQNFSLSSKDFYENEKDDQNNFKNFKAENIPSNSDKSLFDKNNLYNVDPRIPFDKYEKDDLKINKTFKDKNISKEIFLKNKRRKSLDNGLQKIITNPKNIDRNLMEISNEKN